MKKKTIAAVLLCALFVVMASGASAPTDTKKTDVETVLGTVQDDVYINEYFGLGFELPEDWVFFTDEELASMMDLTNKLLEEKGLTGAMTESMENGGAVTNMAAKEKSGIRNINMRLTPLPDKAMLQYPESDILTALSGTVEEMLEQAGYENLKLSIGEVEFAGEKKPILYITGEFYKIPLYQGELLLMKEDYYAVITVTSVSEEGLDEVIARWFTLEPED